MFGVIYVFTNPFLSFLCIDSIKAFRFEPFVPIADNKAFKRLVFAISRFEVEPYSVLFYIEINIFRMLSK